MASDDDILVVGGYGVVGRRIAARLARRFPGRVVVAGRNQQRAAEICRTLGGETRSRGMDVNDAQSVAAALDGVGTVMVCVSQQDGHVLRASVDRGCAYTDLAPDLAFWQRAEDLDETARRTGARVLLGAGLVPGITNIIAAKLGESLGHVERIDTAVLLSLGDEYGPDSLQFMLQAAAHPYSVVENGRARPAAVLSEGERIAFPAPFGARFAFLFPWSDVAYYPKTLGAKTALGRFALDPAWAGHLVSAVLRTPARNWFTRAGFLQKSQRTVEWLERLYSGRNQFALVVIAEGNGRALRASLVDRRQADATAASAAELVKMLATHEMDRPGVWLPEQVVSHERFFEALAPLGYGLSIEDVAARRR